MEPVLINRFHYCADTLRLASRRTFRVGFWVMLLPALLFLGYGIYDFLRNREFIPYDFRFALIPLLYIIGALFLFWRVGTTVNRSVKRTIQRLEETRQVSEFEKTYRFADTEMLVELSISADTSHCPYTVFKRFVPYQNLILAYTQSKQYYILDRTRFENGTESDFWRLMNAKCPQAVPKKYRA